MELPKLVLVGRGIPPVLSGGGNHLWRVGSQRGLVSAAARLWGVALLAPTVAVLLPLHGFGDEPATSVLPNANLFCAKLINLNPLLRLPEFCFGICGSTAVSLLAQFQQPSHSSGLLAVRPAIVGTLLAIQWANRLPYPLLHNGLLLSCSGASFWASRSAADHSYRCSRCAR